MVAYQMSSAAWTIFWAAESARSGSVWYSAESWPLSVKASRRANAVSSLHGHVTRRMWAHLWPWRVEEEIPIGHITNGVHVPSWLAWQMMQLYDRQFPANWVRRMGEPEVWQRIASTAGAFSAFGFDTSLNNAGEVAFTARLDSGRQGLFSGSGGPVTKHYTNAAPVLVDGVPTKLGGGNFGRPSINAEGEIAFWDRVDGTAEGIFAGRSGVFRTLGPTDRLYNGAGDRGDANNNDLGIGAFETSFFDDQGQFVTALVTSDAGVLSVVGDTLQGFGAFGFYAPAINNLGQVAFEGLLRDFRTEGVFTGPDPRGAILTDRRSLDRMPIVDTSISVGPEALNDAGEVVFVLDLEDPTVITGFRTAIYLASPR